MRETIQRGQLTGGGRFIDEVVRKIGRRVERRGRGRPRKNISVPFVCTFRRGLVSRGLHWGILICGTALIRYGSKARWQMSNSFSR